MVDSGVAIRSQLLLCSPTNVIALRAARFKPRDANVIDRIQERTADSETCNKKTTAIKSQDFAKRDIWDEDLREVDSKSCPRNAKRVTEDPKSSAENRGECKVWFWDFDYREHFAVLKSIKVDFVPGVTKTQLFDRHNLLEQRSLPVSYRFAGQTLKETAEEDWSY